VGGGSPAYNRDPRIEKGFKDAEIIERTEKAKSRKKGDWNVLASYREGKKIRESVWL